jgi:hypothetical protein
MGRIGLILKKDLYRVIDEAFEYLSSQQIRNADSSGWHQFLESGKIGNVATAQIMILFKYFNREIPALESCLAFLEKNRKSILWQGEKISGWSYVSSGPPVPCIEPTCWVYRAYQHLLLPGIQQIESEVYDFLKVTRIASQEGCSWGFTPWTEARIAPTCTALRVLSKIGDQQLVEAAVRWLLAARDSQNAWGASSNSTATITHTSLAIIALRDAGYSPKNPVLVDAYSFLVTQLEKWMAVKQEPVSFGNYISGINEIVEVPAFSGQSNNPTRIQYYYNPILLSAVALYTDLDNYLPFTEAIAFKAVKDWDSVRWKHPWLKEHKHLTSWSFYDHMLAIEPFYRLWIGDEKAGILYFILSDGVKSLRISQASIIVKIIKKLNVSFFWRVAISISLLIAISYLILNTMDLKTVILTIVLGVISNIFYAFLKK